MIKIRRATISDLKKLQDLNKEIFVKNLEYDDDAVEDFSHIKAGEKYFKEAISTKDGCLFVAEENGRFLGYANGQKMDRPYRKSLYFEIENLGVVPEMKGKGLGKKLLDHITRWAKENAFQRIYLECYSKNQEAIQFYKKHGFGDIDTCLEKSI